MHLLYVFYSPVTQSIPLLVYKTSTCVYVFIWPCHSLTNTLLTHVPCSLQRITRVNHSLIFLSLSSDILTFTLLSSEPQLSAVNLTNDKNISTLHCKTVRRSLSSKLLRVKHHFSSTDWQKFHANTWDKLYELVITNPVLWNVKSRFTRECTVPWTLQAYFCTHTIKLTIKKIFLPKSRRIPLIYWGKQISPFHKSLQRTDNSSQKTTTQVRLHHHLERKNCIVL